VIRRELGLRENIAEHGSLATPRGIDVALPALEAGLDGQVRLSMSFECQQQ
jgi:hypothetical protein